MKADERTEVGRSFSGAMARMRERKNAFTLIELLVVVGIIGLLLMLLLPALGAARDRAHEALCKNRIRSLAIAATAYEQDYGILPAAEAWTPVAQFSLTDLSTVTNNVFYSYVDTPEPYICPSFKRNAPWRNAVRSYSMNAAVTQSYFDVPPELIIRKSTAVHAPSELVLFAEENWYVAPLNPPYNCIVNDGRLLWWPAFYNDSIGTFHRNNSCMFAFIDGHVEQYAHQPSWRNMFDVRLNRP